MRLPPAPRPQLSANGAELASVYRGALWLADEPIALGHGATTCALSADGTACAACGDGQVSVLTRGPEGWATVASGRAPDGVLHLGLAGDTVVAASSSGDGDASLSMWGDDLRHVAATDLPGPPTGLRLDALRAQALVWGPGYARAYALDDDGPKPIWGAPALDFAPFGYLMPVLGGGIAAYERGRLELLHPERRSWPLPDAETAVAAPGEARVAWLWGHGPEGARARTLDLDGEAPGAVLQLGELGAFTALAVDDDCTVTVATSRGADGLRLYRGLPDGTVNAVETTLGAPLRGPV